MRERVISWLAQFRDNDAIECAITSLDAMKVLGREDNHAALKKFAELNPKFVGATICPLGEIKDSSAVQTYLSRDLEKIFPRACPIEEAAAAGGDKPIVFLDDIVGSGSQTLDILGNWFEDDELKQDQLEETRLPFGREERAFLRSRPVAFVFIAGWKEGLERIRDAATKLRLDATVYAYLTDNDLAFAFEGALNGIDPEKVEAFRERCRSIGADLLASNGKDETKQAERALGYGGRAMLLASRFNVPTQTLTCLWMGGKHDDVDWHPLIKRRAKT